MIIQCAKIEVCSSIKLRLNNDNVAKQEVIAVAIIDVYN